MRLFSLTLIGLALAASAYLLTRHVALMETGTQGVDLCSALFGSGCDAALRNPVSEQFGLPLAGWGIVYYGTLGTLLLLGWSLGEAFDSDAVLAAILLSVLGAAASVVLILVMVSGLSPACPLCFVVHAINFALVPTLKRLIGRPLRELLHSLSDAVRYVLGAEPRDPTVARCKWLGLLSAALVAVVLYQWVFIETKIHLELSSAFVDLEQTVTEFHSRPQHDIPVGADDAHRGPLDATVQLVVFNDFQCPGCRRFSHTMTDLAAKFEGRLQVIFKNYPLDTACNSAITRDLHGRACESAWAAEAARRQGKFWSLHDALFASDLRGSETTMESVAARTDLDIVRWRADFERDSTKEKIASDVKLAIRLRVDSTPAVFLSGRRVYDLRAETLQHLIAHELEPAK